MTSPKPRYIVTPGHGIVDTELPEPNGEPLCVCTNKLNAILVCNALSRIAPTNKFFNAVASAFDELDRACEDNGATGQI